jgi:hypothetical protein
LRLSRSGIASGRKFEGPRHATIRRIEIGPQGIVEAGAALLEAGPVAQPARHSMRVVPDSQVPVMENRQPQTKADFGNREFLGVKKEPIIDVSAVIKIKTG